MSKSKQKRRAKRRSWRDRWRKWAPCDSRAARDIAPEATAAAAVNFRLEPLEERILLTTVVGGERFDFIAPDPGNQDAEIDAQPIIGVSVGGDAIIEIIAADVDDENLPVFGDAPGVIIRSEIGRGGAEILGGLGGADGIEEIGPTPITDLDFVEGTIPIDGDDTEANNIQAIASRDALGFGETYGFNLAAVQIPGVDTRDIVQLLQLDNLSGAATVRAMLHQATLGEDVAAALSAPITDVEAFAVSPTGAAFAIGDVGGFSAMFQINRVNGTVTPIGLLNGGGQSDVRAMAIDSAGRMFVLTQTSALAEVNPATGLFLSSTGVTLGGGGVTENYTGMAFDSSGTLFAVLQRLDASFNAITILHEVNVATAAVTVVGNVEIVSDDDVAEGEEPPAGTPTTIDAITFAVNIDGNEFLVGLDSSELDNDDIVAARLVSISTNNGDSRSLSQPGAVTAVSGLGGFTIPGTGRPLLFAIDDENGDLIRGSAVTLQVDSDTGDSDVSAVLAADFQPRIGNATDDRLFFVAASGDEDVDELFHIDVGQANRSAIQNTMTSTLGTFGEVGTDDQGDGGVDREVTSIVWDQTGPTSADLIGFENVTSRLFTIDGTTNPAAAIDTNQAVLSEEVFKIDNGQRVVIGGITGVALPFDNPTLPEGFVVAVNSAGEDSELLRVNRLTGGAFVLGTLPDPNDDSDDDKLGENLSALTFNPVIPNPFDIGQGALLAVDTVRDTLVIVDFRARFPTADAFNIYVSQASPGASISIAEIDPITGEMIPFSESVGTLRVFDAQTGDLIDVDADDTTGRVYIGARTEDIGDADNVALRPILSGFLDRELGIRARGVDDFPLDVDIDLTSGLVVDENLLLYYSLQDFLGDRLIGLNVDVVRGLTASRDGSQIVAVDTDGADFFGFVPGQFLGNELVLIDPATGNATATTQIIDAATGLALSGVQGLDFGDVNLNGGEELFAAVNVRDFVPRIEIGNTTGVAADLDIQGIAFTPAGTFAVDDNGGTLRLLLFQQSPGGGAAIVELGDIVDLFTGTPITGIMALEAHPNTGVVTAVGIGPSGNQELFEINANPVAGQVFAISLGVLDDGAPVTDTIKALVYVPMPGAPPELFAVRDVAGTDVLITIATDGTGAVTTIGSIIADPLGAAVPTNVTAMDISFFAGQLVGIHDGPGAGDNQIVAIDFNAPDTGTTRFLTIPGSVPDTLVGYTSNPIDLFFSINDDAADLPNTLLVSPGVQSTLGTIDADPASLTFGEFTSVGAFGAGQFTGLQAMAFDIGEGSIPGQQGLYVIDSTGTLFEADPTDASIVLKVGRLTLDDTAATQPPLIFLSDPDGDLHRQIDYSGIEEFFFGPEQLPNGDPLFPIGSLGGDDTGRIFGFYSDGFIHEVDPLVDSLFFLRTFAPPMGVTSIEGMAHDGLNLYAYSSDTSLLYTLDPNTGAELNQTAVAGAGGDLFGLGAFDADGPGPAAPIVWAVDPNAAMIHMLDPATGTISASFAAPDALAATDTDIGLSIAENGSTLIYINSDIDQGTLFRLDPDTGAVLSTETTTGLFRIDGLAFTGAEIPIGSFDISRNGRALGHETLNGRLVDIDLATAVVGGNTATPAGSLRPTVGAITSDFLNNRFLAVDNSTGLLQLGDDEALNIESSVLMVLNGLESDSAIEQSIGDVLIAGALTGQVNLAGSADLVYAGWLLTGFTNGQPVGPPQVLDNFKVGGDLRNLISRDSIGTNDDSLIDAPEYMTGFDLEVAGKVGLVQTYEDFIGSVHAENQEDIPNVDALTLLQSEIESRRDLGVGITFEQFGLEESLFFNDSFDTAQIVGSIKSGILGEPDIVRILGEVFIDLNDSVDFYAVPLLAGKTYTVQLNSFGGNSIGVFDPDGRLIATDRENLQLLDRIADPVLNQPFQFTADRPGLYRFAVGFYLGGIGGNQFGASSAYTITITGVDDIALGAVNAVGNVFAVDPVNPSFSLDRGDLGAILAGGSFFASGSTVFVNNGLIVGTTNPTLLLSDGSVRNLEAAQIGLGDTFDFDGGTHPSIQAPNGGIGLIRSTVDIARINHALIGGDLQLVDAATDFSINLDADGGLGVVRAGSIIFDSQFFLNRDGVGQDGIADLFDIVGDFISPKIDTGPGGNVRYMRIGGAIVQDPFFTEGSPTETVLGPGVPFNFRDDNGAEIQIVPVGPLSGGADDDLNSITFHAYGIRNSGGQVLVRVETNGSLELRSTSFGNNAPVEVTEITISADGIGVAAGADGLLDFAAPAAGAIANLHVDITGNTPVDVFSVVSGTTVTSGAGGAPLADRSGATGGALRFYNNHTGGELVSADLGGVGRLFNAGPIGLPRNHTGAALNPQLYDPTAGLAFPFNQQRFGIVTASDTISIRSDMGIGNISASGSLDRLSPNIDRTDVVGVFEGIGGPVVIGGNLRATNIGEGIAPSGRGDLAFAGLFVTGELFSVTNEGLGSDIRGDVVSNGGLHNITLQDGSIINAEIASIDDFGDTREFITGFSASEGPDTHDRPEFELRRVTLNGIGGIIGSRFLSADIGDITVNNGFGFLFSETDNAGGGNNSLASLTVDGYGIRQANIEGGASAGDINATGTGTLTSTLTFSSTVRRSEDFAFDPVFGSNINVLTDLHLALGTSSAASFEMEGIIEDLFARGSRNLGMVSAYQIRESRPDLRLTTFNYANSIEGFQVDDLVDGLNITTGGLRSFKPGADVFNLDMDVAGRINNVLIKGTLADDSTISALGLNGNLNKFRVDGDMDGTIDIDGRVGIIDIRGDHTGSVTIRAINEGKLALKTYKLAGSLTDGSLDISDDVGMINTAGGLGAAGDKLTIRGNLNKLLVGSSRAPDMDGSLLALDLSVFGDLKIFDVTGGVTGLVTITGNSTKFEITADTVTAGTTLLASDVQIFGAAKSVGITGGDVSGDFAVGRDLSKYGLTGGDLLAAAAVSSTFGNVGPVTVRSGDLLGSIIANNGTIGKVSVIGSDLGGAIAEIRIEPNNAADADTVTVGDGQNTVVFEFESGGGVGAGNTAVAIGVDDDATEDNLRAAIGASILTLAGVENAVNPAQVDLTNTVPQLGSTVPITVDAVDVTAVAASPAMIMAHTVESLKLDGSIKPGTVVSVLHGLEQLDVGVDIEFGATVKAGFSEKIEIGNDMLGKLDIGHGAKATQFEVGRDLGGQTTLGGHARVEVGRTLLDGGDASDAATLSTGGNLEDLEVVGAVEGFVHVGGWGGKFDFGSTDGAVLTFDFGLDDLKVETGVVQTLIQTGVPRGDDGVHGTRDANEDPTAAGIGKITADFFTDSVLNSASGWKQLDVEAMTRTTASSGFNVGSPASRLVVDGTRDLSVAGDRDLVRGDPQRVLGNGDFEKVDVGGTTMVASALSAGVDPGPDGIFGNGDDGVVVPHADRLLPDGGGDSRFGTVGGILDVLSVITTDAGITKNNTIGGTVITNVGYVIGDLTTNNPLEAMFATAVNGAPVIFPSASGTVTIELKGSGAVAVHDDPATVDLIDSLVISGTDKSSKIEITTTVPGAVNIGRILGADDALVPEFEFDGTVVGDGTDDLDLLFDATASKYTFAGLDDVTDAIDFGGIIGGPVKLLDVGVLGSGPFRIGGPADKVTIVTANGGSGLISALAATPTPNVITMATDSTGSGNAWVFDDVSGVLTEVNPTTGVVNTGPSAVLDTFFSTPVPLDAIDFDGSDTLFGVAEVDNLNPSVLLGGFVNPAHPLGLNGLAVLPDTFVQRSTTASTIPVTIDDLSTVTSTIDIAGFDSIVGDVIVQVDISHTEASDLDVTLISPEGTRVLLFSGIGAGGDDISIATIDDDATTPISSGVAPFFNVFSPQEALALLDGESLDGTWTLEIIDTAGGNAGTLSSWSLDITGVDAGRVLAVDFEQATIASPDVPVVITDDDTVTSTLDITGFDSLIGDLNVTLDITHTEDSDLNVTLISPGGTSVELFNGVGAGGANFTNTTLDDDAATAIGAGAPPFTGTFSPTDSLSSFNGESPNGKWTLQIADTLAINTGTLNSWSLDISGVDTIVHIDPADGAITPIGALTDIFGRRFLNNTRQIAANDAGDVFVIFDDPDGDGVGFDTSDGGAIAQVDIDNVVNGTLLATAPGNVNAPPARLDHLGFLSTDVPQAFDDTAPVTSDIVVAGLTGTITDINVTLDITHAQPDEVEVTLISPGGTNVLLFSALLGGLFGEDFTDTNLDDEADDFITGNFAPFAGSFKPQSPLSAIDGENPNGTWMLRVTDLILGDDGLLNDWSLSIATTTETPLVLDAAPFDLTSLAASGSDSIFGTVRDTGAGEDELIEIFPNGDFTRLGLVMADPGGGPVNTNVIGAGFVDGNLVAATVDGVLDALIAIDPASPGTAELVTQAGVVNTDLDSYAVRNPAFGYDLGAPGGEFFRNPGTGPTLVTVNTVIDTGLFTSVAVPAAIPDAGTVTSDNIVAGIGGVVGHVDVTLDITHAEDSDLEVTLISPLGTRVRLFSGIGAGGANYTGTTLNDLAVGSVAFAAAPFSGTFTPVVPLSTFNGEAPNGTWTLEVVDLAAGNVGTLTSWSMNVSSAFEATQLMGLVEDGTGAPLDANVVAVAVDIAGTGDLFAITDDRRLFEYATADGSLVSAVGTLTDATTSASVGVTVADFDDVSGAFLAVDPQRNLLASIDPTTATVFQRTEPRSVTSSLAALSFDSSVPVGVGTLRGVDSATDTFVEFAGTTNAALRALSADSFDDLKITGAGLSSGRFVAADNSFNDIEITGPFSGTFSTPGPIDSYKQSDGDFTGALISGVKIDKASIVDGSFGEGGVMRAPLIGDIDVSGGSLSGTIESDEAESIDIGGDGTDTAEITVVRGAGKVNFDGGFDGVMDLGWVSGNLDVDTTLGATADIMIRHDAKSVAFGGTDAGSMVTTGGYVDTATIGGTHSGVLGTKMGLGSVRLEAVDGGVVTAGLDSGSLSVRGASVDGLYAFGVWSGLDRIFNTIDDLLTGGNLKSAAFTGPFFTDSALVAGILPNINAVSTNVQNRPDDNRVFTGNLAAADITLVDSAEASSMLPSEIGKVSIRGVVLNTSAATGRRGVIAAVKEVRRISAGPAGASLLIRDYGDPDGAPTIVATRLVTDSEINIIFSEPINTGSLVLGKDVDNNGSLLDPVDVPGAVAVFNEGQVLDDVILRYTTQITADGQVQGVLRILRAGGFDGVVDVRLRGPIVDQVGFAGDPAIFDRSGLRSVLRDFNLDGVQELGEDRLGTILDGTDNGLEGGDEQIFFDFDDVSDSFTESLAVDGELALVVDDAAVRVVEQFTDDADIDVFRFTADAFQFLTVEYTSNVNAQMGVFIRDDQGTDDVLDDTFELLTRHELQFDGNIDDDLLRLGFDPDLFMAFELPPVEDGSGFRTTDIEYFVAVFPFAIGVAGDSYTLELTLGSDDTMITVPADEQIAYISNFVGQNNNLLGAQVPKQLVFLDFDSGKSRMVRPGATVEAFDAAVINPIMLGLEDVLINGDSDVIGIVDRIIQVFTEIPTSHPGGTIDIERFDANDLIFLGGDISNLPDGVVLTTEDPSLFGFDPDTEYTTVLIGQTPSSFGAFGEASTIDYANLSKADEIIVFAQNFVQLNTTQTSDRISILNTFAEALGGTMAHELGHVFGLNHTVRDTVLDDPNNNGDTSDTDPVNAGLQNIIAAGPSSIFPDDFISLPFIGTASVDVSEFIQIGDSIFFDESEAYIDALSNFLNWLM